MAIARGRPGPHIGPMTAPVPPRPRKDPRTIEQLGRVRVDEYGWMKDANWRAVLKDPAAVSPEIRAHQEAENAYVRRRCVHAVVTGLKYGTRAAPRDR